MEKMSVKKVLLFMLYVIIFFSLIGISSLWQNVAGLIISYDGFAVDSQGNLYVGCQPTGCIEVYNNTGTPLREIAVGTNRGYRFTITEDDLLLVGISQYIYVMDLHGNTLEIIDTDKTEDNPLRGIRVSQKTYIKNQAKYIKRSPWARTSIYRVDADGETLLYKMPFPDYCARLMEIIGITLFLIPIAYFSVKEKCRERS